MKRNCTVFLTMLIGIMALMLCGTALAGTFSKSTTAPSTNIIEKFDTEYWDDRQLEVVRNGSMDTSTGQTFKHDTGFTMTAITFKMWWYQNQGTPMVISSSGTNLIDIRVGKDTTGNGECNLEIASDTFDLTGQTLNDHDYATFTFATPVGPLDADTTYGVDVWWTSEDASHTIYFRRSKHEEETDPYPDGIMLYNRFYEAGGTFPTFAVGKNDLWDAQFWMQGTEVSAIGDWMMFD